MKKSFIFLLLLLTFSLTACSIEPSTDGEAHISEQSTERTTERIIERIIERITEQTTEEIPSQHSYGVFLSETEDLQRLSEYDTIVIDAQFFSAEQIAEFKKDNEKAVYTYINIGSIEDFREYYPRFKSLTLGPYENWDEEYWIDVSDEAWQSFLTEELIPSLLEKDIDGFFVDNADVYYHYPEEKILEGLASIMRTMVGTEKAVLLNGGDAFLDAYCESGQWQDVITGINQETVFSSILWDEVDADGWDQLGTATVEDHAYFADYVERYGAKGADIYLLEYTRDPELIGKIDGYCKEKGFRYYVSDSVELDS